MLIRPRTILFPSADSTCSTTPSGVVRRIAWGWERPGSCQLWPGVAHPWSGYAGCDMARWAGGQTLWKASMSVPKCFWKTIRGLSGTWRQGWPRLPGDRHGSLQLVRASTTAGDTASDDAAPGRRAVGPNARLDPGPRRLWPTVHPTN